MKYVIALVFCLSLLGCYSRGMEKLGVKNENGQISVGYSEGGVIFLWPLPPLGVGWRSLKSFSLENRQETRIQTNLIFFILLNPMYPTVFGEGDLEEQCGKFGKNIQTEKDDEEYSIFPFDGRPHTVSVYSKETIFFYTSSNSGDDVLLWKKDAAGVVSPCVVYSKKDGVIAAPNATDHPSKK